MYRNYRNKPMNIRVRAKKAAEPLAMANPDYTVIEVTRRLIICVHAKKDELVRFNRRDGYESGAFIRVRHPRRIIARDMVRVQRIAEQYGDQNHCIAFVR